MASVTVIFTSLSHFPLMKSNQCKNSLSILKIIKIKEEKLLINMHTNNLKLSSTAILINLHQKTMI